MERLDQGHLHPLLEPLSIVGIVGETLLLLFCSSSKMYVPIDFILIILWWKFFCLLFTMAVGKICFQRVPKHKHTVKATFYNFYRICYKLPRHSSLAHLMFTINSSGEIGARFTLSMIRER
jgi:hypothetical protein